MGLLQEWREYAYGVELNSKEGKAIWNKYFEQEKAIYQQLLAAPEKVVSGTVQELADKYGMELNYMVGFLDGINESLKEPNPIEEMEADTVVKLPIDLESLYYHTIVKERKVGRNEPCPCGSGKKYKYCCGRAK